MLTMNKKQMIVLGAGSVITIVLFLYLNNMSLDLVSMGAPQTVYIGAMHETGTLLKVILFFVAAVTCGILFALRTK